MGDLPYDLNTIKLTWIKPDDYTILHSKMFDSLDEALKNVRAPIGLNIDAETPEEIAVSILAEIIKVRRTA